MIPWVFVPCCRGASAGHARERTFLGVNGVLRRPPFARRGFSVAAFSHAAARSPQALFTPGERQHPPPVPVVRMARELPRLLRRVACGVKAGGDGGCIPLPLLRASATFSQTRSVTVVLMT